MSCHNCKYGSEDDINPNACVCMCTELFEGKPNEHYLHLMHVNHTCMQDDAKTLDSVGCVGKIE